MRNDLNNCETSVRGICIIIAAPVLNKVKNLYFELEVLFMKRGTIERLQVEGVTQPSVVVSRLFFFFLLFNNNISVVFVLKLYLFCI